MKQNPKVSVLTPSIRPEGLKVVQKSLERQTFKDFEWLVEIGLPARGCDLSASLNRMLKRAKGDRIVMLQDYIKIEDDALEKVAQHSDFVTYPVGKTLDWNVVTWDWRDAGEFREIEYMHWEADWASAPRQAFFDIGGYNEKFDEGWSWENVDVAYRAEKMGYKFYCDPSVRAIAYDHDAKIEHPFRGKNENQSLAEMTKGLADEGVVKLDYL